MDGGIDLRVAGSRNIGARNAYEVTGKKRIGLAVAILDFLKGAVPLVLLSSIPEIPRECLPLAGTMLILGHCYPVWLRFHGGRGLATGAAVLLLLSPLQLLCWVTVYFCFGLIKKHVNVQSMAATLSCLLLELSIDTAALAGKARLLPVGNSPYYRLCILGMLLIIIFRHIEPVRTYLKTSS